MAAVGERTAGGGGAPLSCFICGGGIGRGKELKLQGEAAGGGGGARGPGAALLPFLQQQEPRRRASCPGRRLRAGVRRLPLLPGRAVGRLRARPHARGQAHVLAQASPPVRRGRGRAPRGLAAHPRKWNVAYALGGADDEDEGGGPERLPKEPRDSGCRSCLTLTPYLSPTRRRDAPSPHQDGNSCARPGSPGLAVAAAWVEAGAGTFSRTGVTGDGVTGDVEGGSPLKAPPGWGAQGRHPAPAEPRRHWVPEARVSVLRSSGPLAKGLQSRWPLQGACRGSFGQRVAKTPESRPLGESRRGYCMSEDSDINITSEEEDLQGAASPRTPRPQRQGK